MTRTARLYSESGFSHVILRGIGKQLIFEGTEDYRYFIHLMKKYCAESRVRVNAYCLMDNHVHLILHDVEHEMPLYMKKIGICYAAYYNSKYGRTGHLFQDRYKSVPIESVQQLLSTFRYVLQNPQKAGICPAEEYAWSSYQEYGMRGSLSDTKVFEEMIGTFEDLQRFMSVREAHCSEFEPLRNNDGTAHDIMTCVLGIESGTVLQSYGKKERNHALRILKQSGLSIRQIERLTGIGRSIIQRA